MPILKALAISARSSALDASATAMFQISASLALHHGSATKAVARSAARTNARSLKARRHLSCSDVTGMLLQTAQKA